MAKQATLKELVLGAVEGFLATDTVFSVYDVTQAIRDVVNSGAIEIPALFVGGKGYLFEISHDDVKYYFNELNETNIFSQPLSKRFNGTYNTYKGASLPDVKPVVKAFDGINDAVKDATFAVANLSTAAQKIDPKTLTNKLDKAEVIKRVRTYQRNSGNFKPTPKQIQSAIKRGNKSTGWSRSDLKSIYDGVAAGTI